MLPTIIIGAFVLAILWPFIRLGYELIKLAGSLALLVASCAIGAVALVGRGAWALISACRRHAGTKKDDTVAVRRRRTATAPPCSRNIPRCARTAPEGTGQTKNRTGIYLERTMP